MSRLPPSLLALALAVALCATPVAAQQISTSHGVRTLPRIDGLTSEAQFRQVQRVAEDIVHELLQDIAASESSRKTLVGNAAGITDTAKRDNAELDRATDAFKLIDDRYRADLAAFQQRQSQLEADIARQRNEAAVLQALPSAQRNYDDVKRLNDWAAQIGTQRDALEAERNRLLADHDNVESERAKVAKQKTDAEARLKGMRDTTVGQYGSSEQKRTTGYTQLRTATAYLKRVREELRAVSTRSLEHSATLDEAEGKLRAYEASKPGASR